MNIQSRILITVHYLVQAESQSEADRILTALPALATTDIRHERTSSPNWPIDIEFDFPFMSADHDAVDMQRIQDFEDALAELCYIEEN